MAHCYPRGLLDLAHCPLLEHLQCVRLGRCIQAVGRTFFSPTTFFLICLHPNKVQLPHVYPQQSYLAQTRREPASSQLQHREGQVCASRAPIRNKGTCLVFGGKQKKLLVEGKMDQNLWFLGFFFLTHSHVVSALFKLYSLMQNEIDAVLTFAILFTPTCSQ